MALISVAFPILNLGNSQSLSETDVLDKAFIILVISCNECQILLLNLIRQREHSVYNLLCLKYLI